MDRRTDEQKRDDYLRDCEGWIRNYVAKRYKLWGNVLEEVVQLALCHAWRMMKQSGHPFKVVARHAVLRGLRRDSFSCVRRGGKELFGNRDHRSQPRNRPRVVSLAQVFSLRRNRSAKSCVVGWLPVDRFKKGQDHAPAIRHEMDVADWAETLSPQARRVLELLREGHTYYETGRILRVADQTVRDCIAELKERVPFLLVDTTEKREGDRP